ncbi:hypothetical protein [Paenibacillus sp. GCM10027626]|uniref:hypothetical protein n=1 Tax=Paenibacillus sp. GCM10027626 TaxID=3273411 RepID=UPI0036346784
MRSEVTELREITRLEQVVVSSSIVCNKCGKQAMYRPLPDKTAKDEQQIQMQSFECSFGYSSRYDNENWSFELCEECLLELVRSFKLVPQGFRSSDYDLYDETKHQKIFEHWQRTGEWEPFKFHSYEELLEYRKLFNEDYFASLVGKYYPERLRQYRRKSEAMHAAREFGGCDPAL